MSITVDANYVSSQLKGLQEPFKMAVQKSLESYKPQNFIKFYNTSEWSEEYISYEGAEGVRELGELEEPDPISLNEGWTISITPSRFGGAIEISEDTMVKSEDSTIKVDRYIAEQRNQVLNSMVNTMMVKAYYPYVNAFNSSATVLAPDSVELCGTHLTKDGATWFANKTTAKLSETSYKAAVAYAGAFKDPTDSTKPMPLTWKAIMVKKGGNAANTAKRLFANNINPTQINDINLYQGELTIIETPYISNTEHWFLLDDSIMDSPVVCGMNKGITFSEPMTQKNNAVRTNITMYLKTGIVKLPVNVYGGDGTV